jgi:hypothetical protein
VDSPGQPGDNPGQPEDNPSQTVDSPVQPEDNPSQTVDSPGRPEDSPGQTVSGSGRPAEFGSYGGVLRRRLINTGGNSAVLEVDMAYNKDWLPAGRADQIVMCKNWISIMSPADVRTKWGIPTDEFQELGTRFAEAQALLQKAQSSDRTPVINEQCREAFEALTTIMRFFKGHRFLVPPLTNADLISLGLVPHDTHPTPTGNPKAEVTVETFLLGRHELGIHIIYVSGDPQDKANKGYRIWYKVVPPGGEPVTSPEQLDKSFFTRRKKDVLHFNYEDSGKTAYIAVQIENDGKKGPWGPMISTIIP